MRTLEYRPNGAARALRRGSFRSIGVVMFAPDNIGTSMTLNALSTEAAGRGYSLTLNTVQHPTTGEVSTALSRIDANAVDGLIVVLEEHLSGHPAVVLPDGVPIVIIDTEMSLRRGHPVVDTDQRMGATQATQHLLDLGHPTVWHIAGPEASSSALRRTEAWRATLERAGRTVPDLLRGDWSADAGHRIGRELAADPEVTAIFAANDQMALGVLRAMHEAGRAVPGSVSIVGFDDTPDAANYWPPLTTVHQHFDAVGRCAIDRMVRAIEEGDTSAVLEEVPTELVIRASTAPHRAA